MKQILDAVPQSWIVGVQLYRALGVIFLILYAGDRLPGLFAWPAGLGDILVGLLAPFVAMAYARRPEENARTVAAWNIFGLADRYADHRGSLGGDHLHDALCRSDAETGQCRLGHHDHKPQLIPCSGATDLSEGHTGIKRLAL